MSRRARAIQIERYRALGLDRVVCNAAAPANVVETVAAPEPVALSLLREAAERMRLSARGYHRVLKLARTLADLDGREGVSRAAYRRGAELSRPAGARRGGRVSLREAANG